MAGRILWGISSPPPSPLVLRKVFKTWWISPDFVSGMLQSVDFKEHFMQSLPKMGLSTPGLARAGSFIGAVFGLAPCFYCTGCVKDFGECARAHLAL